VCLIVFSWNPDHRRPLILGANRDEFHHRPSLDAQHWPDAPHIFGGRDLQRMGTWLGLSSYPDNPRFRLAALTNVRQPDGGTYPHSRGELTAGFLNSRQTAMAYCQSIKLERFAGFNGLFYDGHSLVYLHHSKCYETEIVDLSAGDYALSNARLDTPWPKVQHTRQALKHIEPTHSAEETASILFKFLENPQRAPDDTLPDTGVGQELERMLSAAFIISPAYGTRTSTAVIIEQAEDNGKQYATFFEHQFKPDGTKDRSQKKILIQGCPG
jgi:uncharacterized protein with NRDE domain